MPSPPPPQVLHGLTDAPGSGQVRQPGHREAEAGPGHRLRGLGPGAMRGTGEPAPSPCERRAGWARPPPLPGPLSAPPPPSQANQAPVTWEGSPRAGGRPGRLPTTTLAHTCQPSPWGLLHLLGRPPQTLPRSHPRGPGGSPPFCKEADSPGNRGGSDCLPSSRPIAQAPGPGAGGQLLRASSHLLPRTLPPTSRGP